MKMSTLEFDRDQPAAPGKSNRWLRRLVITIALDLASLTLGPMFMTDALTPALLAVCAAPTIWGLYCFLFFRTGGERIVGYVAFLPVGMWTLMALDLYYSYGWHK